MVATICAGGPARCRFVTVHDADSTVNKVLLFTVALGVRSADAVGCEDLTMHEGCGGA